jgi:lipoate-protein ligase A
MVERIEERVRNMVGPFYNMATMLKNLNNEKVAKYLYDNSENISETMRMSIEYLIDMAKIIDHHLPDGFDVNEVLAKRKYQKSNATKDSED